MTETMRAATIHGFGGTETLAIEDVPKPEAQADEVLIRVHAAGVNPIDFMTRQGAGINRGWRDVPFPVILGWDVSGTVVESNSPDFDQGDEVYTFTRFPNPAGAYAEYVAAPAAEVTAKPASIDHETAAGVPLAALTAWQALFDTADLQGGQRVLIHAAAGGVGHFAVQFAKWKGAHVIGTASEGNRALVQELGADEFIDYTAGDFSDAVSEVDAVFHTIPAEFRPQSWKTLKSGGYLLSITGPLPEDEAAANDGRGSFVHVRPAADQLAEIARLIDAGAVGPVIDTVYPLEDVVKAHEHLENGHTRGKVVLRVGG